MIIKHLIFVSIFLTLFFTHTSAIPSMTTSATGPLYVSQMYYLHFSGIDLASGQTMAFNVDAQTCYMDATMQSNLVNRCYDASGPVPSIPRKNSDLDIIPIMTLAGNTIGGGTCSYTFQASSLITSNMNITCLAAASLTGVPGTENAIVTSINLQNVPRSLETPCEFFPTKVLGTNFDISLETATGMTVPAILKGANGRIMAVDVPVYKMVIEYDQLPPNLAMPLSIELGLSLGGSTQGTTIHPLISLLLLSDPNLFSASSLVPFTTRPSEDVWLNLSTEGVFLFTGNSADAQGRAQGKITIPLVPNHALIPMVLDHFYNSGPSLDSATISLSGPSYSWDDAVFGAGRTWTIPVPSSQDFPIPVEFAGGPISFSYDDQIGDNGAFVLSQSDLVVQGSADFNFVFVDGYDEAESNPVTKADFFAVDVTGSIVLPNPTPAVAIELADFVEYELQNIQSPETAVASFELNFNRPDALPELLSPTHVQFSLFDVSTTLGLVPIPEITPLATSLTIDVADTQANFQAQFALSKDSSEMFVPQPTFEVDFLFILRPSYYLGELFPQNRPLPICELVPTGTKPSTSTLRLVPYVYTLEKLDVHTSGAIRIYGTMKWDEVFLLTCQQDIVSGSKQGNAALQAMPWILRTFPHRRYIQTYQDIDVIPTYTNWTPARSITVAPGYYIFALYGPAITSQADLDLIVNRFVEYLHSFAPTLTITPANVKSFSLDYVLNSGMAIAIVDYGAISIKTQVEASSPQQIVHRSTLKFYVDVDFTTVTFPYQSAPISLSISSIPLIIVASPTLGSQLVIHDSPSNQRIPLSRFDADWQWSASIGSSDCYSTLHCDDRYYVAGADVALFPTSLQMSIGTLAGIGLCVENKCRVLPYLPPQLSTQGIAHIFHPNKRLPIMIRVTTSNSATIIHAENEFGYGYDVPAAVVQFSTALDLKVETMINRQNVIIDNNNPEFAEIAGKQYHIQLLSFPTQTNGEIISPTTFRVRATSTLTTIPTAETMSELDRTAFDSISDFGASKVKFRVIFPDLLTPPTTANPNPTTHFDSMFFTVMPACMNQPSSPADYNDKTKWTNACKNNGVCQNTGMCRCVNGFSGTLCGDAPQVPVEPTGCLASPTYCGSNGTCNASTTRCECKSGWEGEKCLTKTACVAVGRDQCSNNGHFVTDLTTESCTDGACECDNAWTGTTCSRCGLDCKNGGRAYKTCTTCGCAAGFTGDSCQCRQQQGSFIYAATNAIVEYVFKLRSEYAALNNISSPTSVSLDVLGLSQELTEDYNQIAAEIAADTAAAMKLGPETVQLNFATTEKSVPDASPPSTYITTRFIYTLTYNCDSSNQIDLQQTWSSFISTVPTKKISKYFTPTSNSAVIEDSGIEDTPTSITQDFTIDTENQPEDAEQNSSPVLTHSILLSTCLLVTLFSMLII